MVLLDTLPSVLIVLMLNKQKHLEVAFKEKIQAIYFNCL